MTKIELKAKKQPGDFTTLGQILGITPDAARKRFARDDQDAIAAMESIILNREQLIENQTK